MNYCKTTLFGGFTKKFIFFAFLGQTRDRSLQKKKKKIENENEKGKKVGQEKKKKYKEKSRKERNLSRGKLNHTYNTYNNNK